jgi:hypothetical protein
MRNFELTEILVTVDGFQVLERTILLEQLEKDLGHLSANLEFSHREVNTKGAGSMLDWNAIIITLAASGGVLASLINILNTKSGKEKSITLEINGDKLTLTGVTAEQQKILIEEWIKRHHKTRKRN